MKFKTEWEDLLTWKGEVISHILYFVIYLGGGGGKAKKQKQA